MMSAPFDARCTRDDVVAGDAENRIHPLHRTERLHVVVNDRFRTRKRCRFGQGNRGKEGARILVGHEARRRDPGQSHESDTEDEQRHQHSTRRANADRGERHIPIRDARELTLEGREEAVDDAVAARLVRTQQHAAERGRERQRHDGREEHRHRDRDCELLVELTDHTGHEGHGHEDRAEHDRGRNDRRCHLVHRRTRGFLHAQAELAHLLLDRFHHDDGVIDDDADREHEREQGKRVDRESEELIADEGREQRHRHRQHRNDRRAPVLQEQENDNEYEDQRLYEGAHHLLDRRLHEHRVVIDDRVIKPRRKGFAEVFEERLHGLGRLERIRTRAQ